MKQYLLTLFLGLSICSCASKKYQEVTSIFWLDHVVLSESNCLGKNYREQQAACHRLSQGDLRAVGFRKYIPNETDLEKFEKFTFVFPIDMRVGDVAEVNNLNVFATHSFGLSYGPGKKGCVGIANEGKIRLLSHELDIIEIEVDLIFDMKSPLKWPNECTTQRVTQRFQATKYDLNSLGAWEGKLSKDTSVTEETHPLF